MAYTTIDDPSAYFQIKLWTGNASSQTVNFDGNSDLQADWIWHKEQNDTNGWHQTDTSIGITKYLATQDALAEYTVSGSYVSSIGSNSINYGGGDSSFNSGSVAQATWAWNCNNGTKVNNTTGNGIDSVVQANTTAGFSIVTYTGNGTQSGQTVGHGLGAVPKMIISKDRNASSNVPNWRVYTVGMGNTKYLTLDTDAAAGTFNDWDNTTPTSSVYSVGGAGGYTPTNTNNTPYVAYVFADVQGYSKFGKYIGNGSSTNDTTFDGAFVYLGFKPAWVLIKRASYSAGDGWNLFDNTRPPRGGSTTGNYNQNKLNPASLSAESGAVYDSVDFLSNGFKLRSGRAGVNASGSTYIYMAFAENPFVTSTAIPTTAR